MRGRNIRAWQPDYEDWWLVNTHNGVKELKIERVNVERDYPTIFEYLEQYEKELKKRQDKGDHWTNLRNCAYLEEIYKPKILYPNMTKFLPFIYDENGYFPNAKCYLMTGEALKYLTAFFNSRLFKFCFSDKFPELLGDTYELQKRIFQNLPVKRISEDAQKPFDIFVDYLTFLHDKTNPPVNPFARNSSIAAVFEDVLNMMIYELYFEEHMKENEIDILRFIDTKEIFHPIGDFKLNEKKQAKIIGEAYSWLQQSGNYIRDRITLANIRSKEIIRKINSSTH